MTTAPLFEMIVENFKKDKLQKFQSLAARVITGATYEIWCADVLETLAWEHLDVRQSYT